jgi:hypothetical protein
MSVNIDLKPLSEEIIKQMGYSESNLWLIKIGSVVFGPFETQTLKHYLKDTLKVKNITLSMTGQSTQSFNFLRKLLTIQDY